MSDDAKVSPFQEYVKRRRRFWRTQFSFVPLFLLGLLIVVAEPYFGIDTAAPWFVAAVVLLLSCVPVCMAAYCVAWFRLLSWPCPQCGKSFIFAWWSSWPGKHCKHCGLQSDVA